MNYSQLADVLQFFAVGGFWIFVLCKMIPDWRLDSFRQNMFIVRDELFDYAADGNISFDHPAYVLLRDQMNGFIRYGHHLTVFRSLMTVAIHKISDTPARSDWRDQWIRALQTIEDDSVRRDLERLHRKGMVLAMGRLVSGSPLMWVMTLAFLMEFVTTGVRQSCIQQIRNAAKKIFASGPINDRLIEEAAQGEFA